MATTTNFGWETPDDTDLVKDGAAAMRTLGNSIDTSFVDLKGGTTGQVLSKNSNTDLDFTWVAQDDSNAIQNAIVDAKGDLISATSADTPARLAVGTNDQVLTADSTTATGLKWATPTTPAANYSLIGTGTLTSGTSVTVTGISAQNDLVILFKGVSSGTASALFSMRINGDTGTNYDYYGSQIIPASTYGANSFDTTNSTSDDRVYFAGIGTNAGSASSGYIKITGCNSAGKKMFHYATGSNASGGNSNPHYTGGGVWNNTDVVTSINMTCVGGSFDAGSFVVYGSA